MIPKAEVVNTSPTVAVKETRITSTLLKNAYRCVVAKYQLEPAKQVNTNKTSMDFGRDERERERSNLFNEISKKKKNTHTLKKDTTNKENM